ncbi:sensor histidine kinase [Ramlibacter sp.]|uniref:sensor histidine kinase n=1 Tax=Ramlibacter sp. TaxID=1917967 RepID=UPI002CA83E9B|nr:ATP-binding protein [Ramlibacter sp.]HWI83387.1 ATP-binding protein [Ramlibacter sp.]
MNAELASPAPAAVAPVDAGRPAAGGSPPAGQEAELKRFAQSLAHELRTPIAAVLGFGKTLDGLLGEDVPERTRHYVRRIRAAGQLLDEYVEALVALTQAAQGVVRLADVDLSDMARQVLDDLQLREPQRRVRTVVQANVRAYGDPSLLRMVLENLLGNAWKFTGPTEAAEIRFSAQSGSGWQTVYRVEDNGVGFDEAYADKLFGDFQRLHSQSEFPGTGLGLANVQRIVARHGGRVWAESAGGRGATFWFTLAGPCIPVAGGGQWRAGAGLPRAAGRQD